MSSVNATTNNTEAPASNAPAQVATGGNGNGGGNPPYLPTDTEVPGNEAPKNQAAKPAKAPRAKAKPKPEPKAEAPAPQPEAPAPAPEPEAPAPEPESQPVDANLDFVERHYVAILSEPTDRTLLNTALRQMNKAEVFWLLGMLESDEAEAAYKAADPTFKAYRHALHATAAQLSRELDAKYGLRREFGAKDGHGVYVEAGPLGTVGAGLGHVHKRKLSNGGTRSRHTGLGVYLRLGAITKQEVSSTNRLSGLIERAKANATAPAVP